MGLTVAVSVFRRQGGFAKDHHAFVRVVCRTALLIAATATLCDLQRLVANKLQAAPLADTESVVIHGQFEIGTVLYVADKVAASCKVCDAVLYGRA